MSEETSETVEAVHRLKQEIDRLTEQRPKALKQAIYFGMMPDEAKEYDQRRTSITQLVQELGTLEKTQRRIRPRRNPKRSPSLLFKPN
jgi:hypothetical protein